MTKKMRAAIVGAAAVLALSGCGFTPYSLPLPGGADVGDNPYEIKVEFRDVLDLVPQSGVRVNDLPVGKVLDIELNGWTALVTLEINGDVELPANTFATLRQTSLLGEKFVDLAAPETGATGELEDGDLIALQQSGRNPEIEEVLGAASLLFNGGGIERTKTITRELGVALEGRDEEVKGFLRGSNEFVGQLDTNKEQLLVTLEQVNRLAVETNRQKGNIEKALDELPEALEIVDEQRSDFVALLESLDRLSGVGTRVIRESKDDTVENLRLLEPILLELASVGDEFPATFSTLLTFPFIDGVIGAGNANPTPEDAARYEQGDYGNLSITLNIDREFITNLLPEELGGATTGTPAPETEEQDGTSALVDLVGGLVPQMDQDAPDLPDTSGNDTQREDSSVPDERDGFDMPQFCSVLGSCRAPAKSYGDALESDMGKMLVSSVVTP